MCNIKILLLLYFTLKIININKINKLTMKKLITSSLLILFVLMFVQAEAKFVPQETAKVVAENYIKERIINNQVDWSINSVYIQYVKTEYDGNNHPAFYVFTNNNLGYIIVSADDVLTPILGYSYEGTYPEKGTNQVFDSYIGTYIDNVNFVRANNSIAPVEVENLWSSYKFGDVTKNSRATTDLEPLVYFRWNQDFPYNILCPPANSGGSGGYTYSGCVAQSMATIMAYYKYPLVGQGSHSYYAPGYGVQSANFGETEYRWDEMIKSLSTYSDDAILAIAEIHRHAGVSVNMGYGGDGSGAYNYHVPIALRNYFKYDNSVMLRERAGLSQTAWENYMTNELDKLRPLYFTGVNTSGGVHSAHAFLCTGYQVTGTGKMYYFDFGWSGYGNGYYSINDVDGYNTNQAILINFVPKTDSYPYGCSAKEFNFIQGNFEDGSSPIGNYSENLSCTWLINPNDTVNSIRLTFSRFEVHPSDKLYIYDGPDENSPLLAELTGSDLPEDIVSTGDKVFVKFVTDGADNARGWEIHYSTLRGKFCMGTKVYREASGELTDGSGDYNYHNNSNCNFRIAPPFAKDLTLTFTEFDLEEGKDFLTVYKFGSNTPIAELTGNEIPEPITIPDGAFFVNFRSDILNTAAGFKAYWTTGNVGVGDVEGLRSLTISPNPATNYVTIKAFSDRNQDLKVTISDLSGKELITNQIYNAFGDIDQIIDVSRLSSGMYFVTISGNNQKVTEKLIVK